MKLIKNKKIFGCVNVFDFLFILLIIMLLFVSYYRFFLSDDKEVFNTKTSIVYTAKVENVRKELVENIQKGDFIFLSTAVINEYRKIGKIVDIEVEPYKVVQSNLDGTIKNKVKPECYNLILTIHEDGKILSSGYYTSTNEELYTNANLNVATKYASFEMKIQNIEEKK